MKGYVKFIIFALFLLIHCNLWLGQFMPNNSLIIILMETL